MYKVYDSLGNLMGKFNTYQAAYTYSSKIARKVKNRNNRDEKSNANNL